MSLPPVITAPLLAPLHDELLRLLRSLAPEDWERPATPRWRVRDVAAHLLDGDIRRLSAGRDGNALRPDVPIHGYDDLVGWLNWLNAEWVGVARRMSPAVIVSLLQATGPQVADHLYSLEPDAPALWPVGWAGEETSPNWMDVGREYTERWHHQQQIRDATGRPGLTGSRWMRPVLALSMRALPRAYARTESGEGTSVVLRVEGDGGGSWTVRCSNGAWILSEGATADAACALRMDADTAWRVLLHALPPERARPRVAVEGDAALAEPFLHARAVMV
ncbi:maleylpyruvate isomerase family mycothiol-dependent enzyme [Longimicrobium sp.]|uniref:maleylpyruvate isomerase N-terminal domain-containing protein n=1 Tax=Longimicrobium sp. TaxID=2029185 RepID=UPI002E30DE2C|nr:maleylpyruvate isomerase family mycothiol-dependent enzyme [Longimicrobium sp.]HEX6037593.1 maleylpyruvate isomerase family mycothiol-dependent enzyme [Longimicrobium sp.]